MKIFLVMHVQGGLLVDVHGFSGPEQADEYEKALCNQFGLPFDRDEREKYYEENEWEDEVHRYDMTVESNNETAEDRLQNIGTLMKLVAKQDYDISVNTFEELLQLIEEYEKAVTKIKVTIEKT